MTLFEYAVEVTVDIENMKLPYADVHGNLKLIMETSINGRKVIPMVIRYLGHNQYCTNK